MTLEGPANPFLESHFYPWQSLNHGRSGKNIFKGQWQNHRWNRHDYRRFQMKSPPGGYFEANVGLD